MMVEVYQCDFCGKETHFVVNGAPYCEEHAMRGIAQQARLSASLRGASGEEVAHAGEWAQEAFAQILVTGHGQDDTY